MFSQQIRPPIRPAAVAVTPRSSPAADSVEEPLVHGRHQLAVLGEQALRADQHRCVVQRPRALILALVDPDRAVDAELGTHLRQTIRMGPGHVHRVLPRRSQNSSQPSNEAASRPSCWRGRAARRSRGTRRGRLRCSAASASSAQAFSIVASASRITGVAWTAATRMVGKSVTVLSIRRSGGARRRSGHHLDPLAARRHRERAPLSPEALGVLDHEPGAAKPATVSSNRSATTAGWPSTGVVGRGVDQVDLGPVRLEPGAKGAIASGAAMLENPSSSKNPIVASTSSGATSSET